MLCRLRNYIWDTNPTLNNRFFTLFQGAGHNGRPLLLILKTTYSENYKLYFCLPAFFCICWLNNNPTDFEICDGLKRSEFVQKEAIKQFFASMTPVIFTDEGADEFKEIEKQAENMKQKFGWDDAQIFEMFEIWLTIDEIEAVKAIK